MNRPYTHPYTLSGGEAHLQDILQDYHWSIFTD